MCSKHNKGKYVITERYIITLKNHSATEMKPVDVKTIDSSTEINDKDLKFKVSDHVRISKYKNTVANGMFQVILKNFLRLKKLKTLCRGLTILEILAKKKVLERFTKNNCKRQIQKSVC